MSRRVVEFDYSKEEGFVIRIRPERVRAVPRETREHLLNASKEFLLALRGVLDSAIRRIEEEGEREQPRRPRRVAVKEGE